MRADIVYEFGNLIEFFGGTAPEIAYNNWVSHVTEGIASDGYNDYGSDWLDVQTNGFGNHFTIFHSIKRIIYCHNLD